MAKVKEVTTVIEDEVTFMVDPQVEFVSLVKYGANRAPFKVIKNQKTKEEPNMNKVVQSILVRNDLSDEELAKAFEGIDKRSKKEFTTFTAYPQVALSKVNKESLIVTKHEEVEGVFFVLGDLAEEQSEQGTLTMDIKEAVNYATIDNLYTELYAMADVVGGAMRQENADAEFRQTTILKAIDNFRAFAEVVLENLSAEKLAKGVDPKDHPDLVVDILHAVKEVELTDEEKKAKEEAEAQAVTEGKTEEELAAEAEAAASSEESDTDFSNFVASFNDSLNSFGDKIVASLSEIGKTVEQNSKDMKESLGKVTEEVQAVQNTVVASKSETDEELEAEGKEDVFKGTLFNLSV
jgi:hypothetical protein